MNHPERGMLTLEMIDRVMDETDVRPQGGIVPKYIHRYFEVAWKAHLYKIKGWRDGWQKARYYRRLLRSLSR